MGNWFFAKNRNTFARLDELDERLIRRDEVTSLLQSGEKIRAINIYREDTGASLRDAKAAVERMEVAPGLELTDTPFFQTGSDANVQNNMVDMANLHAEVERLLAQGEKIKAIKIYRERTGLGLREAKEAVDRIDSGLLIRDPGLWQSEENANVWQSEPNIGAEQSEVERLVAQGEKLKAIKMYRQLTGMGLREAKETIDQMESSLRQNGQTAFRRVRDEGPEPFPQAPGTETRNYLRAGEKIRAIKAYREQTGLPLKEAKEEIERLEQAMRAGFFLE